MRFRRRRVRDLSMNVVSPEIWERAEKTAAEHPSTLTGSGM